MEMNCKEISETLPLNLFDIYEMWSKIDEELEQSDTGRIAKRVLDEAGNQIGRILLVAAEEVLENITEAVVDAVKDAAEEVVDFFDGEEESK